MMPNQLKLIQSFNYSYMSRFKNEVTETKNEYETINPIIDGSTGSTGSTGGTETPDNEVQAEQEPAETPPVLADTEGSGKEPAETISPVPGSETVKTEPAERSKRGRKPGGKNAPKNKEGECSEGSETKGEGGKNPLDDILNKIPGTPPPNPGLPPGPPKTKKVDVSKFVSGALMLSLIDSIAPHLVIKAASMVNKDKFKDIDTDALKLDTSERKELSPLADEAVKEMLGEMSPSMALLIALGILYGGKLMVEAV